MAGQFTGTIGSIIRTGFQVAFGVFSIPENASEAPDVLCQGRLVVPPANWCLPLAFDEETSRNTESVFDEIEQHVVRSMQVISPCMQIAGDLKDAASPRPQSTSAEGKSSASTPQEELIRFAASGKVNDSSLSAIEVTKCEPDSLPHQSTSTSKFDISLITNNCEPCGSCLCSSASIVCTAVETEGAKEPADRSPVSNDYRAEEVENDYGGPEVSVTNVDDLEILVEVNVDGNKTVPQDRELKVDESAMGAEISKESKACQETVKKERNVSKGRTKVVKPKKTFRASLDLWKCYMCQVRLRKIHKPISKPCGHMFCYTCLISKVIINCPCRFNGFTR